MKKQLIIILAFTTFLCTFAQETPLSAQPKPAATPSQQNPTEAKEENTPLTGKVTIAADHMETVLKKIAKLDGNVEVVFIPTDETLEKLKKQFQDDEVRLILNSDHMVLTFAEENGEATSRPEKIQGTGRVRIHTPDGRSATGDQAEWDMTNGGVIVLEGKCTVLAEGRVMNSSRITYDIKENRLNAERAIITLPIQSNKNKKETGDSVLDTHKKTAEEKK